MKLFITDNKINIITLSDEALDWLKDLINNTHSEPNTFNEKIIKKLRDALNNPGGK